MPTEKPISFIARTTATAAISVHFGASCGKNDGLSTTENQTPFREGENHPRESRPFPAPCASATTTVPSGVPSIASRFASLFEDGISS